jgi:hypothetical protein
MLCPLFPCAPWCPAQLLSEGVRLVREGRGARFSSVWNTMSSRGGGADTPRSGDQDTFGTW